MEWVGGIDNITDYARGNKSLKAFATDALKADVNVFASSVSPIIKTPFEAMFRQSLYPDAFKPSAIRDRGAYIAKQFGLETEYKKIAGLPTRPYSERLSGLFVYKSDPLEAAYYSTYEIKGRYIKDKGKQAGFWVSPKSTAFYYLKMAHRYGDKDSEEKFLKEYTSYVIAENPRLAENKNALKATIGKSIHNSLKAANPLYGIPVKDRKDFLENLNDDEKDVFARAIRYYNETIIGTTEADIKKMIDEIDQ
jgi:hypothetical protein